MEKYGKTFIESLQYVLENEGYYSNNPDDPGGETFRGISRKFHPDWKGWVIIDKFKKDPEVLKKEYLKNKTLQRYVAKFYYFNFYKKSHADFFEEFSPTLAYNIFDYAINAGVRTSLKNLQTSLNILIKEFKLKLKPLMVDGIIGPHSTNTFKIVLDELNEDLIIRAYQNSRVLHYINLIKERPIYLKFIKGWVKRSLNFKKISKN